MYISHRDRGSSFFFFLRFGHLPNYGPIVWHFRASLKGPINWTENGTHLYGHIILYNYPNFRWHITQVSHVAIVQLKNNKWHHLTYVKSIFCFFLFFFWKWEWISTNMNRQFTVIILSFKKAYYLTVGHAIWSEKFRQ